MCCVSALDCGSTVLHVDGNCCGVSRAHNAVHCFTGDGGKRLLVSVGRRANAHVVRCVSALDCGSTVLNIDGNCCGVSRAHNAAHCLIGDEGDCWFQ